MVHGLSVAQVSRRLDQPSTENPCSGSSLGLTPCSTQTWQRRELAALTQNFFVFYIFRPETECSTFALILWFHIILFFK